MSANERDYAEKRDFIRKLAKERGIVILTDSDNAGRQIRAYITSFVPSNQIRHAYIPDIYGKENQENNIGNNFTASNKICLYAQ